MQVEAPKVAPPLLRVIGTNDARFMWLRRGRPGSLQTAAQMANLVREDAVKDEGLERFAKQILINNKLDSHSDPRAVADALYNYTRQLTYTFDPEGSADAISSARQTIRNGYGDCDDLSVLLATLFAMVGFKPSFTLARYADTAENSFDHVYVSLDLNGTRVPFDPVARKHGSGWESPRAKERVTVPIFGGAPVGLGDIAAGLKRLVTTSPGRASSTAGNVSGSAMAANGVTFPVVLVIIAGTAGAMKLADHFLR